ncbi:MAG: LuxR family transcriptional regulator [Coriobacteriaceae bacterium]|nr:LuxR family transcriptional regulator [Coriobacteriaceae bacterium]
MVQTIKENLESISLADIFNVKVFGFAATFVWSYLTFFSTLVHFSTRNDISHLNSTYTFMLLGSLLVLMVSGFVPRRFHSAIERRAFIMAMPTVMCVATVLLALVELGWFQQPWCTIICICSGLALGFMYLSWGVVFKRLEPRRATTTTIASFSLAALAFALVLTLPREAALAITALLPLMAALCLAHALHDRGRPHLLEPLEPDKPGFLARALLSVGILALAAAFMRSQFLSVDPVGAPTLYPWVFLAATGIALVVLVVGTLSVRGAEYGMAYRITLFMAAFIFLLLPLLPSPGFLSDALSLSTYCAFNMLVWTLLARTASVYQLSPLSIFGFGWGALTLGTLAGDFIGKVAQSYLQIDSQMTGVFVLFSVLAVLFEYFFLFDEKNLIGLTREEGRVGTAFAGTRGYGEGAGCAGCPSAKGANSSIGVDRHGSSPTGIRKRPFHDRCEEVARRFDLSSKETEVMILFAKGRSNPRIQEELNISPGTVNTHLSRIYKKLDVHDKQSLIDLLEGH